MSFICIRCTSSSTFTHTIKTELYSYGISILILCEWYFFSLSFFLHSYCRCCCCQTLFLYLYYNNEIKRKKMFLLQEKSFLFSICRFDFIWWIKCNSLTVDCKRFNPLLLRANSVINAFSSTRTTHSCSHSHTRSAAQQQIYYIIEFFRHGSCIIVIIHRIHKIDPFNSTFFITENATCICNVSIFVRFRDRSLQCGAHNNNKQKFVRNCFLCHLLDLLFVCIRKGNKCKYTQKLKAKKKLKFMEINEKIIIE